MWAAVLFALVAVRVGAAWYAAGWWPELVASVALLAAFCAFVATAYGLPLAVAALVPGAYAIYWWHWVHTRPPPTRAQLEAHRRAAAEARERISRGA